jgi:hypothetical protein
MMIMGRQQVEISIQSGWNLTALAALGASLSIHGMYSEAQESRTVLPTTQAVARKLA